jgi:hypothetical protein
MDDLFKSTPEFYVEIGSWFVASVTSLSRTLLGAEAFN